MTSPTPGWYADPNDRSIDRWWNGTEWTDPTRARPPEEPSLSTAGWYPDSTGHLRWWDGSKWGPYSPAETPTRSARPTKSTGAAYVFLLLLGSTGAHQYYVGRPRHGAAYTLLFIFWVVSDFGGSGLSPLLVVLMVMLIVDLFILPSLVRAANWVAPANTGVS